MIFHYVFHFAHVSLFFVVAVKLLHPVHPFAIGLIAIARVTKLKIITVFRWLFIETYLHWIPAHVPTGKSFISKPPCKTKVYIAGALVPPKVPPFRSIGALCPRLTLWSYYIGDLTFARSDGRRPWRNGYMDDHDIYH